MGGGASGAAAPGCVSVEAAGAWALARWARAVAGAPALAAWPPGLAGLVAAYLPWRADVPVRAQGTQVLAWDDAPGRGVWVRVGALAPAAAAAAAVAGAARRRWVGRDPAGASVLLTPAGWLVPAPVGRGRFARCACVAPLAPDRDGGGGGGNQEGPRGPRPADGHDCLLGGANGAGDAAGDESGAWRAAPWRLPPPLLRLDAAHALPEPARLLLTGRATAGAPCLEHVSFVVDLATGAWRRVGGAVRGDPDAASP